MTSYKKTVIAFAGFLIVLIFLSGCVDQPGSKVILLPGDSNGTDNNKVAVSANDTTPNYLFSKFTEGNNIDLEILNPGGNETIQISSTATSSSSVDSNKVGVTVNDTTPNFLFSKLSAGANVSLAILNPGANELVQISATGSAAGGRTYTSGTPATIQVNNDTNTISQNFDGNFSSRINALDLNNSLNYSKVNCDSNVNCTFTGKITTTSDANFNNIKFNGTLSGGDFNYSLSDANGTQTCPAGQALQTIGSSLACIAINSAGTGRTYTSGTPATIQVDNDLNTISQNFDGNFVTHINALDLNNSLSYSKVNCDNNVDCTFTGKITTTRDANFNNIKFLGVLSGGDFNYSLNDANGSQTAAAGSALSSVGSTVTSIAVPPFLGSCDNNVNCTFTGKITTTRDANFQNIKFLGVLSGGDFNYSLSDANGSQTATAGQALSSVGATVTSIAIPPSLGTCDNNTSCTITGRINTIQDANIGDLNVTDINAHGNVRVDNNVLVSKDLNVARYTGFDSNVTLNPTGIVLRFKDFTGRYMCLGGNNIDVNGGIWIYAC